MNVAEESLKLHRENRGKLSVNVKVPLRNRHDLSVVYTPGVAQVCTAIYKNPADVYTYTIKKNTVAVVTDGSAVLGLGNIGPEAALPVMEGKCALFKAFAGIDAFPICLKTQDSKEIINIIRNIAPVFGGINLEDISAPRCFEIEDALQDLGIPVFHDDQHGTAIVVLAALINAAKVLDKHVETLNVVINGAGAAGISIAKLLLCVGMDKNICSPVKNIIICDSKGIIHGGRTDLNPSKKHISELTNPSKLTGSLEDALKGADVFIGVSKGNLLTKKMVKLMNSQPIIFAMANPVPEIMPDLAKEAGAVVIGTGRSDFANQINNVLAFPGIFKGALEAKATSITPGMKIAAAYALKDCVEKPTSEKILPDPFDKSIVKNISQAVKEAAIKEGISRTV
jgi:malate dehydrogenase (oxaloacetate-decarboxylating)